MRAHDWPSPGPGAATGVAYPDVFGTPTYQRAVGDPARSGGGIDGTDTVIGGTSAVAPLWAALTARLVQATGKRFTDIHTSLYTGAAPGVTPPGLRDITNGSNGAYQAGPGWDACTGLGVPVGDALLTRLTSS